MMQGAVDCHGASGTCISCPLGREDVFIFSHCEERSDAAVYWREEMYLAHLFVDHHGDVQLMLRAS